MRREVGDRRTAIADATITVLARAGARGLTHRAVDAAAALPPGSTSYYFRTREALLVAAAHRMADLDLTTVAPDSLPGTLDGLVHTLSQLVHAQCTASRERTVARYHLSLEADRYPEIHAILAQMGHRFTAAATAMLTELGTSEPQRDARAVIAVCAGIVYESTVGAQDPYTIPEIAAILRDLLAQRM